MGCHVIIVLLCSVLLQVSLQSVVVSRLDYISPKVRYAFEEWTTKYGKNYENELIKSERLMNFATKYEEVTNHNEAYGLWQQNLNEFADLSFSEFSNLYLMASQNCSATRGNHQLSGQVLPPSFDWRKEGEGRFVSPIKNQGHCGSCWTFSTTGCLESAIAIHNKDHPLLNLSEQQLVDCAQNFNNHGCEGGLPSHAFEYIKYNKGLEQEQDYPYRAKDEPKCTFKPSLAKAFVQDVVNITANDEDSIVDAVATMNPVSVAFEVIAGFQSYKGGVYFSPKCSSSSAKVNHAVLVVGYGSTSGGMPFWIIKNSWGPKWGLNGYFLMERGKNMCGIATCASYPIVPS